jgi:hypothetical protein
MTWLKRRIRHWLDRDDSIVESPVLRSRDVDVDGLNFNIMSAQGGTIVQIRHYDRKSDRNNTITHVIPDGENIAERVGQIVSMEILRA